MSLSDPHDAFFKAVMGNPANAREFMRQHLDPARLALCDLSTLKQENESFVDEDLRDYCCDLLWSVRTKNGGDGFIYWLLEHQSTADPLMGFRMMHYAVGVMYRWLKKEKGKRNTEHERTGAGEGLKGHEGIEAGAGHERLGADEGIEAGTEPGAGGELKGHEGIETGEEHKRRRGWVKIPVVIPVLFYTGKRNPYPYSLDWYQTFDDPALAAAVYGSPFQLVNVSEIPDEEIVRHRNVAVMEYLFKQVASGGDVADGCAFGDLLAECQRKGYTSGADIYTALTYAMKALRLADRRGFIDRVAARQMPQVKESIMSYAMTFEEECRREGWREGRMEGRLEGEQQGERRGRLEGRLEVARNMLNAGMSFSDVQRITRLSGNELKALRC